MICIYSNQYREIADLFHASVHGLAHQAYTLEQIQVWCPDNPDYEKWKAQLEKTKPYLFIVDRSIAGFVELEKCGHIDRFYVHPQFARRGVATALLKHVFDVARSNGLNLLYTEASHLIKPLFENHGFKTIRRNVVNRNGIELDNWIMECTLG